MLVATLALSLPGCTRGLRLVDESGARVVITGGPWASMVYLAATDSGVIAIDLGWGGAERKMRQALTELGATPSDVRYVFLTHAHRDHTAAWRIVRGATFVLGVAEVPFFTGTARYRGLLPRIGDRLVPYPRAATRRAARAGVRRGHGIRLRSRHRPGLRRAGSHRGQHRVPDAERPVRGRRDQLAAVDRVSRGASRVLG